MGKVAGLVELVQLKNEDYISIQHNGVKSYGGNQSWWIKDNPLIYEEGCGIISMCDLELYVKMRKMEYEDCSLGDKHATVKTMTYWEYKSYIDQAGESRYRLSFGRKGKNVGLLPITMVKGLKTDDHLHEMIHGRFKSVKWAPAVNSSKTKEYIIDMLSRDIPVVASYYVLNKNNKLDLYSYNPKTLSMKAENNIKGHYFNITGYGVLGDKEYLKVSSWGKKYYISYDEWAKKLSVFSNILFVK